MQALRLTSARALSSQLGLISLILSLPPVLGQMGKVMGIIISSMAMSFLVYSINIPRMTLRHSGKPKHGVVISLASGWMYMVGVLVVQGTLGYAGRETALEPETNGNYAFFTAFLIYMALLAITLVVTEKCWHISQEDIGGGPVGAYAGMLGMAGIFGTLSIIVIGIFARKTSGDVKERFLTIRPLRRKRKKGIKDTLEKAAPTTAYLFLLMLFSMPNINLLANDLFQFQASSTDIMTISLLVFSFLGTLTTMYYGRFGLPWRLLASFPFMLSLCLAVAVGSMSIYPVYRSLLEGMSRTLDAEAVLFLDSFVSTIILLYVFLMLASLHELKVFPNGATVYPLFSLASLTVSSVLDIQTMPQSTLRMVLIFLISLLNFSIVTLAAQLLKRIFQRLHSFTSKHVVLGRIMLVPTCIALSTLISAIWLLSVSVATGSLDIILSVMEIPYAVLIVCSITFPFLLLDSSELVRES